ncbi:unnamed protein product [Timema podura]|uniref:Uncharacterized protein n=1 Tax=Timema podura TaxID=61482 RepID=A0ABN7NNT7_TIMPD|nr:unnamed protein product [Timema podura]
MHIDPAATATTWPVATTLNILKIMVAKRVRGNKWRHVGAEARLPPAPNPGNLPEKRKEKVNSQHSSEEGEWGVA